MRNYSDTDIDLNLCNGFKNRISLWDESKQFAVGDCQ